MNSLSRRQALRLLTTIAGGTLAAGCKLESVGNTVTPPAGRLTARPGIPSATVTPGTHQLPETSVLNGGLYFVPATYNPNTPVPLVVLFHGAGGRASELMTPMSALAEELGMALFATDSRDSSWDVIANGQYGVDVNFLDRALKSMFARVRIDPARVGVAGFSDGASYALSLGIANGDLFSHVAAFSPGGIAQGAASVGKPAVFITHGTRDQIIPISITRSIIMPRLQAEGYAVELHEFDGTHQIPPNLMRDAAVWLRG